MPPRLPRSVAWSLFAIALSSFVVGVGWETFAGDNMQHHPYLVNVLSGMTGFSSSALVVTLGVSRFLRREYVRRWSPVMGDAVGRVSEDMTDVHRWFLLEGPVLPRQPWRRGGPLLDDELYFRTLRLVNEHGVPEAVSREQLDVLLRLLDRLLTRSVPAFEKAFDVVAEPDLDRVVGELRRIAEVLSDGVEGDALQGALLEVLLGTGELLKALAAGENYRLHKASVLRRRGSARPR
ncbi:hypothetical protein [Micromonospora rubida]